KFADITMFHELGAHHIPAQTLISAGRCVQLEPYKWRESMAKWTITRALPMRGGWLVIATDGARVGMAYGESIDAPDLPERLERTAYDPAAGEELTFPGGPVSLSALPVLPTGETTRSDQ